MLAKLLIATDLHKRDVDFTSIVGFTRAVDVVQADILKFIQSQDVTHFVSTGDWYDKGYREIGKTKNDDNIDRAIARAVNGQAYICIGNHLYLERDQNPEMYMIQPNNRFRPASPIYADHPIFNAVDCLTIGTVQISFFHFDKDNKLYIADRKLGITYHIGIYHDDSVVPSSVRARAGYPGHTSTDYLETILQNVDLAIVGHVHTAIGVETIYLNSGRKVPMIIPGALSITQNKESHKHKEVNLPVITINDDSTVSCKLFPFSLHMELLKFYEKKESKSAIPQVNQVNTEWHVSKATSLREHLTQKGYGKNHMKLLDRAVAGGLDLITALRILTEEEKQETPEEVANIG